MTKDGFHALDYDDSNWEAIQVPSSNNVRNGPHEGYQGVVWYRRRFIVPDSIAYHFVKLILQGSNYFTDVWLNELYVGYHEGGFTPFAFDVTPFLIYGTENLIAIRVDNIPWDTVKSIVPYKKSDWWNYGGIYREIYLEATDRLSIVRVDVTPMFETSNVDLHVRTTVFNYDKAPRKATLSMYVFEAAINETNILNPSAASICGQSVEPFPAAQREIQVDPDQINVTQLSLNLSAPKMWHPSDPNLYVLKARLQFDNKSIDEFYTQFGVREIKVESSELKFNGEPIFLKGMARHEDYPTTGRIVTVDKIWLDFQFFKEANANWVRTAHYPNHPYTYILTDRVGLLVWEEIPVYWFDGESFNIQMDRGIAEQMLLKMIYRDYNSPSIVFWGILNEAWAYTERIRFFKN